MRELPNAKLAAIDRRKICDYLLARDHPEGGPKAHFFLECGFDPAAPEAFETTLRAHAGSDVSLSTATPFGVKYVVDAPFVAPDGRSRWMRSIWIIHHGEAAPHFVTAYPLEAPREPA